MRSSAVVRALGPLVRSRRGRAPASRSSSAASPASACAPHWWARSNALRRCSRASTRRLQRRSAAPSAYSERACSKWKRRSDLAPLRRSRLAHLRPTCCRLFGAHRARAGGGERDGITSGDVRADQERPGRDGLSIRALAERYGVHRRAVRQALGRRCRPSSGRRSAGLRRSWVSTLAELNAQLLAGCETDLHRRIAGRQETVGEAFARERPLLRGLPAERVSTAEQATPRVNAKALVTIKQNSYSVPVRLAGLRVHSRVGACEIELHHSGELVARHERLQGRFGVSASLDHYLELLARKPGALAGSLALSQERERGAWPSVGSKIPPEHPLEAPKNTPRRTGSLGWSSRTRSYPVGPRNARIDRPRRRSSVGRAPPW
jgi:Mu transposase, C-terminal domain